MGFYSLSGRKSYRKISRSLQAARDSGVDFPNRSEIWQAPRQYSAAEKPLKFQGETIIATSNHAASRLREIWRQDVLPLSE